MTGELPGPWGTVLGDWESAAVEPLSEGDGRTARRERNVEAVLDALIELAHDGNLDPTAEQLADRAGVSHRSIYRYFENRDALLQAASARVMVSIAPTLFFEPVGVGTFDERVRQFVGARVETYRAFLPLAKIAHGRRGDPVVDQRIDDVRVLLRDQLARQFQTELGQLDDEARWLRLLAVDVAFQFEGLEYFTASGRLDFDLLRAALEGHLRALLGPLARSAVDDES